LFDLFSLLLHSLTRKKSNCDYTIYYRRNRFCFDCGIPKPTVDEPTDFLSSGCSSGTRLSAVYLWFPSCRLHASAVQYVHVLSFWKRDRTSMASYTWEGSRFNCVYRIICIGHRDLHFANLPTRTRQRSLFWSWSFRSRFGCSFCVCIDQSDELYGDHVYPDLVSGVSFWFHVYRYFRISR